MMPAPLHVSHRPPFVLNEKRPGLYPRICDSGSCAKRSRMYVKRPVYVAGFERGVRPIGLWSMAMTLSTCSSPVISS